MIHRARRLAALPLHLILYMEELCAKSRRAGAREIGFDTEKKTRYTFLKISKNNGNPGEAGYISTGSQEALHDRQELIRTDKNKPTIKDKKKVPDASHFYAVRNCPGTQF